MPIQKPQAINISISLPWISLFSSGLLIALFLTINQPQLIQPYALPALLLSEYTQIALIFVFILLISFDIQRFQQKKHLLKLKIEQLEHERNHIWQSKKRVQERSHIYLGQADKLKRFISNKLLEYVEYDEKLLHFKNIAAEVRHNGVISYDIVRTALENAVNNLQSHQSAPKSFTDTHRFGLPNNPNSDYQQALDAMKYLWDLLDLSTAENIALHIGNHLIECEEQYYEMALLGNEPHSAGNDTRFKPYFSPSHAAIKTLAPLIEPSLSDKIINEINNIDNTKQRDHYHESSQFRIYLNKTENLLGNENHIILLLENLVKNAQFFSSKNPFKQKSDRISVQLNQGQGYIEFKIYNRGPHIKKADYDHIFQLGFSTRKVKENNGKGMGLFFAKEIVNGYEGKVETNNIYNTENTLHLHITLINEITFSKTLETQKDKRRIKVKLTEHQSTEQQTTEQPALVDTLQWDFDKPIANIAIETTNTGNTLNFTDLHLRDDTLIIDPENPFTPHWQIEVKAKRKQWTLKFTPLDISGVEFSIKLPSAEASSNGTEPCFLNDFANKNREINDKFKDFEDF